MPAKDRQRDAALAGRLRRFLESISLICSVSPGEARARPTPDQNKTKQLDG